MNGLNHPLRQYIPQQTQKQIPNQFMISGIPLFQNPIQKMNYILQAMQNPAQFARQHLGGVPEKVFNDPTGNALLQYMQQHMGVTQQDIQNVQNQIPR